MRRILLNSLQLNAVTINSAGERWRGSHAGAPPVVPDVPDIPDIPEEPDVDENGYIIFADPEVKRVLLANGVGDGVGITKEQAAEVTDIKAWFKGNTEITSFDELIFFTSLTNIGNIRAFEGCANLESIDLSNVTNFGSYIFEDCTALRTVNTRGEKWESCGNGVFNGCSSLQGDFRLKKLTGALNGIFKGTAIRSVVAPAISSANIIRGFENCVNLEYVFFGDSCTTIGTSAIFSGCTSMKAFIISAATPPSLHSSSALNAPTNFPIYVPDASVSAYREATNWSSYASCIFPVSQLATDNPDLYNEIKDYL